MFDRACCPVCNHRHNRRWFVCDSCGSHGRDLEGGSEPIGKIFFVFYPENRKHSSGAWGWAESVKDLKIPLKFDESTTPTRPPEMFSRTREDDQASDQTEKLWEEMGMAGRPI